MDRERDNSSEATLNKVYYRQTRRWHNADASKKLLKWLNEHSYRSNEKPPRWPSENDRTS